MSVPVIPAPPFLPTPALAATIRERRVYKGEDVVVTLLTQQAGQANFVLIGISPQVPLTRTTAFTYEGRWPNPGTQDLADIPVQVTFQPADGGPPTTLNAGTVALLSIARPPQPAGLRRVPEWVEGLADALGWLVTAWVLAQALMWVGFDNFIVAAAVGVAIALLFPNFVEPARQFFKGLFMAIFETVVELLEFMGQWLAAVAEHFQGNILRAIIRMVALAAFMWVWSLARGIPVIGNLIDLILDTAGKIRAWVNAQIDGIIGQLLRWRDELRAQIGEALQGMGELGKVLREDILAIVNQLFNGLTGEFQQLRYELLGRLDIVGAALRAEVEILGQRIRLVPQEVVAFLRSRVLAAQQEEERRLREGRKDVGPMPVAQGAPWVVVEAAIAEAEAAAAGIPLAAGAQQDPLEVELRRLTKQAPGYLQGWLDGQITDTFSRLEKEPARTQVFADAAVLELQQVLAGAPPAIPDLPPDLVPVPPSIPPEPEA